MFSFLSALTAFVPISHDLPHVMAISGYLGRPLVTTVSVYRRQRTLARLRLDPHPYVRCASRAGLLLAASSTRADEDKMKLFLLFMLSMIGVMGVGFAQQSATPIAQPRTVAEPRSSAEIIWADLMEGNQRFIDGKPRSIDTAPLRQSLATSQKPKVVVLACSDSRVPPEILFDKSLGDLFVVRSAGNVADAIGVGSIEYAVEHLGSSVLVVLGHTGCGAVKAACSGEKMPTANLQAFIDKIAPAVTRAKKYAGAEGLEKAAIRENVQQSANAIIASSEMLQHFVHDRKLTVFEAVYDLSSGKVVRLDTVSNPNQQSMESQGAVGDLSGFTWKH